MSGSGGGREKKKLKEQDSMYQERKSFTRKNERRDDVKEKVEKESRFNYH